MNYNSTQPNKTPLPGTTQTIPSITSKSVPELKPATSTNNLNALNNQPTSNQSKIQEQKSQAPAPGAMQTIYVNVTPPQAAEPFDSNYNYIEPKVPTSMPEFFYLAKNGLFFCGFRRTLLDHR